MIRLFRIRRMAFGVILLMGSHGPLEVRNLAVGQEVSKDAEVALKERDRLWELTQELRDAGKLAEAIAAAEAMLAIERKVPAVEHEDLVVTLDYLAGMYLEREDFAAARRSRREALEILRKLNGESHSKVTDARLALEDVNRVAGMTREHRRKLAEANRLNGEVMALIQAGKDEEAILSARRALALCKEVLGERHRDYATSLNNLAYLLSSQGDYAAARPIYEKALAIRKEVLGDRHPDYVESLNNLAAQFNSQGDYAAARPLLEKALAINPGDAQSLNNLGYLLERQGDYAAARPLYERSLAMTKELEGERHPHFANSLINLASLLKSQGDYAAARSLYEQALAIRKEALGERHPDYATSLNSLAGLLNLQADYAAARPLYEQAVAIRKEVLGEHHLDYAISLMSLGGLLADEGDYAAVRPLYDTALAIAKKQLGERHPDYADYLNNFGNLLRVQGGYAAAGPFFEKALAIRKAALGNRHPDYASSLQNLGSLHWARGDYPKAAALLKQAVEIAEGNLGLAAAAQSERQQLAMAQHLILGLDIYLSLAPLAKLAPGDVYRHVLAYKGAVFERQQRVRVLRRRFLTDPRSRSAQRFAEYEGVGKKLAALALTAPESGHTEARQQELSELARLKDELEVELARLDAGFRVEEAESRRTPEQLQTALPSGTAVVDFLQYMAFQPPAQGKGQFQFERRLVAFVVRPNRPIERIDLGPTERIEEAIEEWVPVLHEGQDVRVADDPGWALRRLIWEPVETHLVGVTTVLVSSDGPLGQIPLAALPGKKPNSYLIEERSISVVPVPRMLSSTSTVPSSGPGRGRAEAPTSLLLAGDVDYGAESGAGADRRDSRSAAVSTRAGLLGRFDPLPATGAEIASIGRDFRNRFRGAEVVKLAGNGATEEAFRRAAPRSRYLHMATHGYFAPPELRSALGPQDQKRARAGIDILGGAGVVGYHPGLLSGVVLAGANRRPTPIGQDDGILTALEVSELDLSGVDLVVLSACETGLGEVAGGEGLLGLQRAFQVADAKTVVASLWSVNDDATGLLIAEFYRNLWEKNLPKGEALRQAQLKMLRGELRPGGSEAKGTRGLKRPNAPQDYRKPYYWAAFVLSGDWR